MKTLIIGYGAVGEVLTRLLVHENSIEKILCIDYLQKEVIQNSKVSFQRLDLADTKTFLNLLKTNRFDLAINTSLPKFNREIMKCCLETKVNYMDLASQWDPAPNKKPWSPPNIKTSIKSPYKVEEFDYELKFKKEGLNGLIVAGVSPGLTNLFAREAADQLDSVNQIKIRLVDYSGTKELYFAWSKEGLLDEVGCKPLIYENGKFKIMKPFSGIEVFDYPKPFGKKETNLICQDEIGTLPFFIKANKMDIKDYDNLAHFHRELYEKGKLSRKEIIVNRIKTTPFEQTCKSLPDVLESLTDKKYEQAQFAFVIEALGEKAKKKKAIQYFVLFPNQGEINRFSLNANFISYPTALSASLFARAMPLIKEHGIFPPENLDSKVRDFIIQQLPKNHVKIYKKVYTPK